MHPNSKLTSKSLDVQYSYSELFLAVESIISNLGISETTFIKVLCALGASVDLPGPGPAGTGAVWKPQVSHSMLT